MTEIAESNNLLPVIAILGRPNVGKSTLFNALTRSRQAIVADEPGITRDRLYGEGKVGPYSFIVIDTGGVGAENSLADATLDVMQQTEAQAFQAAKDADAILLMVDAQSGRLPDDDKMVEQLRRLKKKVYLVVNKVDGIREDTACLDFYEMGIGEPYPIAASHGRGLTGLMDNVFRDIPQKVRRDNADNTDVIENIVLNDAAIRVAIIGRPNVGKSTFVNSILHEERVLVADLPGTTRDSIFIPFERGGKHYTLIDTAGVRRKSRVSEGVEKFSVIKTLQAIEYSQVCVFMIDAQEGVTEQDLHLLDFIVDAGKALVVGVNKWDGELKALTVAEKNRVKDTLTRRLGFVDFAPMHFLSALKGTGIRTLFASVQKVYHSATKTLSTPELTRILQDAVKAHEPPPINGRRIKLRYAHPGGHNPPVIVIHGNQVERLPDSYQRYLMSTFRSVLRLSGTPIRLELKSSENPFAGRVNLLTPRQERKKKRLMTFYAKQKKK